MGIKEAHTVAWKSDDGKVVLSVTRTARMKFGDNIGRNEYIWTLANMEAGVCHTYTSSKYGCVYSGVDEEVDAFKAMKTLVVMLDAWQETVAYKDSDNADLFHSDNLKRDERLFELYDQYGDEMYADCAMPDVPMVEDSIDPTMREY